MIILGYDLDAEGKGTGRSYLSRDKNWVGVTQNVAINGRIEVLLCPIPGADAGTTHVAYYRIEDGGKHPSYPLAHDTRFEKLDLVRELSMIDGCELLQIPLPYGCDVD